MAAPLEQRISNFGSFHAKPFPGQSKALARALKQILLLVAALTTFIFSPSSSAVPIKEVRRVLILNVFEPLASPGVGLMDRTIVTRLQNSPYQIELYSENLEATLFPDEASQRQIRDWYIRKYRDRKPDVIIAVGPTPLQFMMESHDADFPGIPVVFCGSTVEMLGHLRPGVDFTGTWGVVEPEKTLVVALHLQPSTKHVVVVGGVGTYDRYLESIVKRSLRSYESKLDFTYLTNLDMPTLLERLRHLPRNSIIYHTAITEDAAGTHFIDATESVPLVAGAANAPVFAVDDVDVGRGTVGGYVLSLAAEGETAAAMVLKVLSGIRPQDIPIEKSPNIYLFDSRALDRWGLKEKNLPPGSVVVNREPTLWEAYKWYIIGGILLISGETLLIVGLLWQRARRRKVESELAIAYDRLRLAFEAGKSVGWDWDLKTGKNRCFGDLQTVFGIPADTYSGDIEDFRRRIYRADREIVWKAFADAKQSREPFAAEFHITRTDGATRWITARGKYYFDNHGNAARMLGIAVDITDRKAAEEALSSLSGRLIEAQEEERSRIAREIHDDYTQRLAVLAIDLEEMAGTIGQANGSAVPRLYQFWNYVSELAADLHALSHSLHSSTLENLGLVAGISAFCEEFADQQDMQIDFVHENVPPGIPQEAELCIFRVVQESLRNVKRHSGTDWAEVRLDAINETLHLSISDHGIGFDPQVRPSKTGIGLRNIEERLRLMGGRVEIHSRLMEGTRIEAWLAVKVASMAVN